MYIQNRKTVRLFGLFEPSQSICHEEEEEEEKLQQTIIIIVVGAVVVFTIMRITDKY